MKRTKQTRTVQRPPTAAELALASTFGASLVPAEMLRTPEGRAGLKGVWANMARGFDKAGYPKMGRALRQCVRVLTAAERAYAAEHAATVH